ncbi:hypothetical protein TOPH_02913 [Tolypocladium ophioglossoides CBS 100239]|uniref:Uncharacterized protein n=1 Tax=Tolypocladium ophioglossoides (strain CBS 100239) TaxID=1163406 RepID=A0A0L0NDQ7_TOLOC|nr:hypothetical protein TOPH_02913 [Tolypocladium ophioglossoides CBS 100239]
MQDSPKDSAESADGPPLSTYQDPSLLISPEERTSTRESVGRDDFDEIRGGFRCGVWNITRRYCSTANSMEELENYLHMLWYGYFEVSKYLSFRSAKQDRFAFEILRCRGLGRLTRPAESSYTDSFSWEDLPFLVTDMTGFWINHCARMTVTQRLNFAHFLAKLASAGLDNDGLFRIALILFRDTFETVRPLGRFGEPGHATENPNATMQDLSIAALLPAACAWLSEASPKIVRLSDMSWNDCPTTIGQGGTTFTKSELGQKSKSSAGFSPWRWLYWLKRLQEIADEGTKAEEARIPEYASKSIHKMLSDADWRDSLVLRELQVTPGLVRYQDRCNDHEVYYEWKKSSDCHEE